MKYPDDSDIRMYFKEKQNDEIQETFILHLF